MNISSHDLRCRYLGAFGTCVDRISPFGNWLKEQGVVLPADLPLEQLVHAGWVRPLLRVSLPPGPFNLWEDFPQLSMKGTEACPPSDEWALDVYHMAATTHMPTAGENWWKYFLDDPDSPLTAQARAHAVDPSDRSALPAPFRHARGNQEIRPWIDYFAYWQVYPIVEVLHAVTIPCRLSEGWVGRLAAAEESLLHEAHRRADRIAVKWNKRGGTFDWLSRVRAVLGASVVPERRWTEVRAALLRVVEEQELTPQRIKDDIRGTLLVMWQELSGSRSPLSRGQESVLGLLRQDIELALMFLEQVTEEPVDFLDQFWYDQRATHEWARLIDALPREEELARRDFPRDALMYLTNRVSAIPALASLTEAGLRSLVGLNWERSRPLRRFVLAFHRLHEQLHGEQVMESKRVIRRAERIEQFNLVVMHAERVLSLEWRERDSSGKYPSVNRLARETLERLLGRVESATDPVKTASVARLKTFLDERAMLHNLDPSRGLLLVEPNEVQAGDPAADHLIAAMVNLVIGRNYAAHHEDLDTNLVYPGDTDASHAGNTVLASALVTVVAALDAR